MLKYEIDLQFNNNEAKFTDVNGNLIKSLNIPPGCSIVIANNGNDELTIDELEPDNLYHFDSKTGKAEKLMPSFHDEATKRKFRKVMKQAKRLSDK